MKAKAHDSMLKDTKAAMIDAHEKHGSLFALENPVGVMQELPFMQPDQWNTNPPCRLLKFDSCVFNPRHRCKKPYNLWTNHQTYNPAGITGTGQCENGGWPSRRFCPV